MSRWLLMILGLFLAVVAGYALLSEPNPPAVSEIDEVSRQQLQQVIDGADEREGSKR